MLLEKMCFLFGSAAANNTSHQEIAKSKELMSVQPLQKKLENTFKHIVMEYPTGAPSVSLNSATTHPPNNVIESLTGGMVHCK